nr:hypothetical protein [Tanacetum cinerariifolium]
MGKRISIVCTEELVKPVESINQGQDTSCETSHALIDNVPHQGDYELVSKKNLWEFVAKECGLDITHAASLKLIFVKYLIELDQWLSHWGFKDIKLETGELAVSEKLDWLFLKMGLSGIKTIDGRDEEFGGFDLNIDPTELEFARINNDNDKDKIFGGLDLNIAPNELGFADDKDVEVFGGLDLNVAQTEFRFVEIRNFDEKDEFGGMNPNIAQTEFGFPRTNKGDEKDKVFRSLDEKNIDLSCENFVKTVDIKHNELCPMDVIRSQSKNNTVILSKNVKTVGRPQKRKKEEPLSGIKTIDGRDEEFGGFDLNIDQTELEFARINNDDDKDEIIGRLDLNIAQTEFAFSEIHNIDEKVEEFCGMDLNVSQTKFEFSRTNYLDEKDMVSSSLDEKKIDKSSERFETVDIKHKDDKIIKLCPMDVHSSQSKNNTVILSKNVKTVGRPRKRKKEEPFSSSKMLEWLANAARNPHDLTFGSIPRSSKWKKYKGNEVWKQVLLVKETLFAKQNVDSGNKLDCSQKKRRRMHPSMYEDDHIPIHLSSKRIRCSQRVSSIKSCSCPGCTSCSSSRNKRVKKTPQILETIQTQDDACEDVDTESESDIVRAEVPE